MATILCASYEWNLGFAELRAMQESGFDLRHAHSGADALRILADGHVDALIVSRTLPDVDVSALVEYVKDRFAGMPVVMLTSQLPRTEETPELVDTVMAKAHAAGMLVPTLELLLSGLPHELHNELFRAAA